MTKTPATQLTLRKLRKDGWPLVKVVERWNQWARKRQDLFGFDVIAIRDNEQFWVQCTSAKNVNARLKKLYGNPDAWQVMRSGNITGAVWGWQKVKNRYQLKRQVNLPRTPETHHTQHD